MSSVKISVVIPVYKSQNTLCILYNSLVNFFDRENLSFEIIFVEDNGGDDSWGVIQELSTLDGRVIGLQLSKNYGQHAAIAAGIQKSTGDYIVTMDDDLQHNVEEIKDLMSIAQEGYDVVYGYPKQLKHSIFRNFMSEAIKKILYMVMRNKNARYISAFRIFNGDLRMAFNDIHSPYINIDVMLSWVTNSFSVHYVENNYRKIGESGYRLSSLISHTLNMITGFTTLPLRIASVIGLCLSCFGVLSLIYVLVMYIINQGKVPGFTFLSSIIIIFSGAQLLALGIIGEYLGRCFQSLIGKPPYIIRRSTDNTTNDE